MSNERRVSGGRADLEALLAWEEALPPVWFREAVEAVIADFPIAPRSVIYGRRGADGAVVVGFDRGGWVFTDRRARGASLRVAFAASLQSEVFDGQGSEPWGQAWPVCPGHSHAPSPRVVNGEAVWICPREERVLAPVGRLAPAAARSVRPGSEDVER